jgi:hypothetical protein
MALRRAREAFHIVFIALGSVTAGIGDPQVRPELGGFTYEPPGCVPLSVERLASAARRLCSAKLCRVPSNAMNAGEMTDSIASNSGHVGTTSRTPIPMTSTAKGRPATAIHTCQ